MIGVSYFVNSVFSSRTYVLSREDCFDVDGRLFTGDAFIPGVKVFTGFPMGDRGLAAASVERILGLSEGVVVCAGHEG